MTARALVEFHCLGIVLRGQGYTGSFVAGQSLFGLNLVQCRALGAITMGKYHCTLPLTINSQENLFLVFLSRLFLWGASILISSTAFAQIDPEHRNLVQLGYDQPLKGQGPQGIYAYYFYNNPEFFRSNQVLRLAIAPAYLDGELGFKEVLSPYTDLGLGFYGGAYGDNYYEVRRGHYFKGESFDGHGQGGAVRLYQLLYPG